MNTDFPTPPPSPGRSPLALLGLAGLVLALLIGATIQVYLSPMTVATVGDLAELEPSPRMGTVRVLGYQAPGDWGDAAEFRVVRTNLTLTNEIRIVSPRNTNWAYIHEWNGDVRKFGAIPYQPRYTLMPWGYKATNSAIGTGDFSVWIRAEFPTSYTQPVGLFEISPIQNTNYTTATLSSFGMRASAENWGFVFRSTTGSSGAGVDVTGAAVLDSTPAALAAYAGQTVNVVVTRSGTNAVVYFNGSDVTSLFTYSNPAGWAKSLGLGSDLLVQVGNNVNPWYWAKPVHRFGLKTSAITATEAADPESVVWNRIDFTPEDVTEPRDLTPRFNAAGAFLAQMGGGKAIVPPGVYRLDLGESIRIGQRNHWNGPGNAPYPSVFNQAFRPGAAVLCAWFGATNAVFKGDLTQGDEVCLSLRSSSLGTIHSTWLRSRVSDLVIAGPMSATAEGVFLDRVAAVEIENVSFYGIPGHPIRVYGANNVKITGCDSGAMGKGLDLRSSADVMVQKNFFDSPRGPAIRWACNLSKAINNTFEVSQDPRASTPAYENPTSVNTSTDEFTATNYYGHLMVTGQPIRFDAATGTLPTPISPNTDYFAIVTGKNTFKVSTTYADEVTQTGAFYGNGVLDITSTGSTTTNWYSGVAQSFNFLVSGDHNIFQGNHGQQGYDGGMRLEGSAGVGGNNSIIGNSFILSGYGNPNPSQVAGLVLVDSDYNLVMGNLLDDRDNSAYSQNGVIADTNSLYNCFVGNSFNVDVPYTIGIPFRNPVWDVANALFTSGDVYITDAASANTNIYYAIRANNASAPKWRAENGTLTVTNSGTGQGLLALEGTYSRAAVQVRVNSTTTDQSAEVRLTKNETNSTGTNVGVVSPYSKLGEIAFAGVSGPGTNSIRVAARVWAWSDSQQWTDNATTHSQIGLTVTPTNSATDIPVLILQLPNASNTNDSPIIVGRFDGSKWVSASSGLRFTYGTNNSGGPGKRSVLVDNN